ncbi:hypothetical protein IW261DRAFT_1453756 [Armillaria novae-zelandiae]|uniref:Uncharacterized protein n=1 Tax=Armillaria novae-zelandiae TaxID=153914 RepID=A0AA39PLX8_9AGAR|nr:hypothetical protein IW261DRAFT_1453756 [Armillaria novae-zelandiae]
MPMSVACVDKSSLCLRPSELKRGCHSKRFECGVVWRIVLACYTVRSVNVSFVGIFYNFELEPALLWFTIVHAWPLTKISMFLQWSSRMFVDTRIVGSTS